MNPLKVILASASPRRRQFLAALGLHHTAIATDIDESPRTDETAEALAARLACSKALALVETLHPDQQQVLLIGADTVVALDGVLLGKPGDRAEATAMLRALRGQVHQVHSGLALVYVDWTVVDRTVVDSAVVNNAVVEQHVMVNTTHVTMRAYTEAEIAAYVATDDPLDKAGAYAIQDRRFDPVARLDGCPAGVMGLPAADLLAMLSDFGVVAPCALAPVCAALTGLACCQIDSPSGG